MTDEDGNESVITLERNEGTVTEEGTALNSKNLLSDTVAANYYGMDSSAAPNDIFSFLAITTDTAQKFIDAGLESVTLDSIADFIIDKITAKLADSFTVEEYTASVATSANGYGSNTFDVTKEGYTALGILGVNLSGTNTSYTHLIKFILTSETEALVAWKNTNSSATVTPTVAVKILYIKEE